MPDNTLPLKMLCKVCDSKLDLSECEAFSKVNCPVCNSIIRVPKRFDKYLLEKVCGVGGMSKVYRALDPSMKNRVAIKIFSEEFSSSIDFERSVVIETQLVNKLNHQAFVPIYEYGKYDKKLFLVMEFMSNGSLQRYLSSDNRITVSSICKWFYKIAEGLNFALSLNIVHHDIKPSNILLSSNLDAKLTDFDLVAIHENNISLEVNKNMGSPAYSSPERLYRGTEDYRGDIFSFGVSLYEMLSKGQLPFKGECDVEKLLNERFEEKYSDLYTINPMVSRSLSNIVRQMLSYNPPDRPNYTEIMEVLKKEIK